jgi:hypothetical protein
VRGITFFAIFQSNSKGGRKDNASILRNHHQKQKEKSNLNRSPSFEDSNE